MADDQLPAVKDEDTSVAPSWLTPEDVSKTDDGFDSSDVTIPRVKLLQGTSEEIANYDNAKIGHFWHTGLDMDLGSEVRFIVADRRKQYLLMAPIQDGQGILARSEDCKNWDTTGKWSVRFKGRKEPVEWEITDKDVTVDGLTSWGSQLPDDPDSPPAATLFYDYLVYLPDFPDLGMCILSCARTQIKKAKKGLNDKIQIQKDNGRPMQTLIFSLGSVDDSADGQDFKNVKFTFKGFVQQREVFDKMMEYSGALSRLKLADEYGAVEGQDRDGGGDATSDKF